MHRDYRLLAETQIASASDLRSKRRKSNAAPAVKPAPFNFPTRELRVLVPQSHAVDQARSIVFGKSPNQPLGVSIDALLRRKECLYGGDDMINRSGGAVLLLEVRSEMNISSLYSIAPILIIEIFFKSGLAMNPRRHTLDLNTV